MQPTHLLAIIIAAAGATSATETFSCGGSALCTNGMSGDFASARDRIGDTVNYYAGGANSGECYKHAAIFVRNTYANRFGTPCPAKGEVLKQYWQAINDHGCKACGFVDFNNGCQIARDYVSKC